MFGITTIVKENCMHMKKASGLMFAVDVIHANTTLYSASAPRGPSHAQHTYLVSTIQT